MTWKELKDFTNGLTDEQLSQTVKIATEERLFNKVNTFVAAEDYINPSGDGAEPVSAYDNEVDLNGEPWDMSNEPIVMAKGSVLLEADWIESNIPRN